MGLMVARVMMGLRYAQIVILVGVGVEITKVMELFSGVIVDL